MSKEIKNHSPSPGLLFSDDGVRFVNNCLENRTFGEVFFVLVCLGKVTRESLEKSSVFFHGIQTPQCLES